MNHHVNGVGMKGGPSTTSGKQYRQVSERVVIDRLNREIVIRRILPPTLAGKRARGVR